MKDKLITPLTGEPFYSCHVCHQDTIDKQWCKSCSDISKWRFTANPVQTEAHAVLQLNPNQSLIIASKTGTGKTQIAYDAIQQYFSTGADGKVFWINPLKQIVREKVEEISSIFSDKKVLELTGDTSEDVGFGTRRNIAMRNADIIITSQEMFDSLTRKPDVYLVTNDIGLVVVDEIHGIGDHNRGAKLDGALTRFLLRMKRFEHVPQIVALSATFDNIRDLASYFNQFLSTPIEVVTSDFSPIRANVSNRVYVFERTNIPLFVDLVRKHYSKPGGILCMQLSIPGSKKLATELNMQFGEGTAKTHFSEMSRESKNKTVEEFNNGEFKVLCCTPTLLAGVNVGCTVIILNLTFFNPLTMETDVLAATSIRQAAGRVGRLPRFNEGWVEYIADGKYHDKAMAALRAPNHVQGAIRSALPLVLNIEISMQSQSVETLKEWYEHSYSGYSDKDVEENFNATVEFLVEKAYCERVNDTLVATKKGTQVAKNFVDPIFFENCISQLNQEYTISSTEQLLNVCEELFTVSSSPIPWTEGKLRHIKTQLNFEWMYRQGKHGYDWSVLPPKVQWAESMMFTMERVQQVSEHLEMSNMTSKLKLLNYCVSNGMIPVPLARIGMRLDSLGGYKLGVKYMLYLHLNDVTVDDLGIIRGPTQFKSPASATYNLSRDKFLNTIWTDEELRYAGAAVGLVKHYDKEPENKEISDEKEVNGQYEDDDDKFPWEV